MMSTQKPYLLLTNDDGIHAPGILALADALEPYYDLLIVAPHEERSATGHGVTFRRELRVEKVHRKDDHWGYSFDGKPADCVKFGAGVLADRKIDLVVSGINLGQNLGVNVLYSGTVAAAREAALRGLPAIAFSQAYHDINTVNFDAGALLAADLVARVLARPFPDGVFLNVNIPQAKLEEIQGFRVTRQGTSGFEDHFQEQGKPSAGNIYRNIGTRFAPSADDSPDVDDHAVAANYVSVSPMHVDTTAHHALKHLESVIDPEAQI